jgi:RecA/RadA recombinase
MRFFTFPFFSCQAYIENAVEDLEAEQGGNAMLVDAQHCFDPYYSKALGVNVESLIVCQPDNWEMALESGFYSQAP